jgi:malonyl-CoA decarboxylase
MAERQTFFNKVFGTLADSGRALIERQLAGASERDADKAVDLASALISERGEASGAALSREVLNAYLALDDDARIEFFARLADRFDVDPQVVATAAADYQADPGPARLAALAVAVEAPRQELFRRLNMAPGGTRALVTMRRQVLAALKQHPEFEGINNDLMHLFGSWFNRGFLTLEEITWHTPAVILEKLIEYEAVHAIDGWDDLRRRLEADRRCFAFFHPSLPEEPLIFVEVALVRGMSAAIAPLLERISEIGDPARADTAVFYSINNCQTGLRGISFGNFLIKQVAFELKAEFPNLKRFATLSPVPRFADWLKSGLGFKDNERPAALIEALRDIGEAGWHEDEARAEKLRGILAPACAFYLANARRRGRLWDPVAQFHLGNGARLERINWLADLSSKGLEQSAGLMVNYLYRLEDVETNHEAFVNEGVVAMSGDVRKLARASGLKSSDNKPQ